MSNRTGDSLRFVVWALAAAALLGIVWALVSRGVTLAEMQRVAKAAGFFAKREPALAFAALAAAQAVGMAFSLPTKALLTLLAGALLGIAMGSIATLVGVLAGTSALFCAVRFFLKKSVSKSFGERAKRVEARISKNPIRAMMGMRLFIALPYGPCTICAALTEMSFRDFLIGSALGDIPVIILYAAAGRRLFELASTSQALSPSTVAVLVGIGALLILSAIMKKKDSGTANRAL